METGWQRFFLSRHVFRADVGEGTAKRRKGTALFAETSLLCLESPD